MSRQVVVRAIWNGDVVAESADTIRVEGNHYFPRDAVRSEHLVQSSTHTICPWKGRASYYSIIVGDKRNDDAAWYYPHPWPLARRIKNRVAFWRGVEVMEEKES